MTRDTGGQGLRASRPLLTVTLRHRHQGPCPAQSAPWSGAAIPHLPPENPSHSRFLIRIKVLSSQTSGLPRGLSFKEYACQCRRHEFNPWVGNIPWRRAWQPTPVFLPGESHGQKSLAIHAAVLALLASVALLALHESKGGLPALECGWRPSLAGTAALPHTLASLERHCFHSKAQHTATVFLAPPSYVLL